jgi:hypothetical protein
VFHAVSQSFLIKDTAQCLPVCNFDIAGVSVASTYLTSLAALYPSQSKPNPALLSLAEAA